MNIFVLDTDPIVSAQLMCDKQVVKPHSIIHGELKNLKKFDLEGLMVYIKVSWEQNLKKR